MRRGIDRCAADYSQVIATGCNSPAEWATRSDRLAAICDRRARWWSVLARWSYSHEEIPLVFLLAVVAAIQAEKQTVLSWRESAGDWRRRCTDLADDVDDLADVDGYELVGRAS